MEYMNKGYSPARGVSLVRYRSGTSDTPHPAHPAPRTRGRKTGIFDTRVPIITKIHCL